ncbi:MAG TPA: 2-amino-4-hydroxy-6-hydroxymethyldihydropteridine diphosphokinase [Gammaproteobacteria bacterium]|nr:2-amino-4-hydroxy-6-hydroxymethyldihydropteridine diphosphokinase [Gammaproteobacteria bacterium]
MARAFVSIGSNIERERNVRAAVAALRHRFGTLQLSRVYQNRPIGFDGEDFYNLVVGFDTSEPPEAVAAILHDIEQQQGRVRGPSKFSARSLDLDLLLYDNLVRDDEQLRVPRDEIREYACVLGPLAELAPEGKHPETGETFTQMWARFPPSRQQLIAVELSLDG